MQSLLKIGKLHKGRKSILLTILLLLMAIVTSILISNHPKGLWFLTSVLGFAYVLVILAFPIVGFYTCFILAFFVFDLIRFFDTDLPFVALLDILSYLTFIGVLINKAVKKESFWKNCNSPIVFMFVLGLCYFVFQFFNPNGGSNELYILFIRRVVALILFFYNAINLFKDYNAIKRFFIATLFFSVIVGVYGCYQQWFGLPKYEFDAMYKNSERHGLILLYLAIGSLRKASFLSDYTAFGLFMSGTSAIALVLFMQLKTNLRNRVLLLVSAIILPVAMSFSGTRTATAMLLAEIGLYVIMTINQGKTVLFAGFIAILFIVIMIMPSYGNQVIPRLRSTFDTEDASLNVRNVNRKSIQPYIHNHPIGGGVETAGAVYEKYNVGHPLAGFPSDSGLLGIALDLGWVGLIIQCFAYFMFIQQGIHAYYKSRNPRFKALLLAATICVFGYVIAEYSQVAVGQIPGIFVIYGMVATIIRLPQIEASSSSVQKLNNQI